MASVAFVLGVINICVLSFLLQKYIYTGTEDKPTPDELLLTQFEDSYDYIVVGSGSSGSVVAARLSEDDDVTVLVLEAGHDDRNEEILSVPAYVTLSQHSKFDWNYFTEPQEHACLALKDKKSYWPRGRVLGGTSQLNYMLYTRGNRFDYDRWAAHGCDGWSYEEVLPYFKKSEDMAGKEFVKSRYHSSGGPLKVSKKPPTSPLTNIYMQAVKEMGYNETDYNGETQEGFSIGQSVVGNGERCSTSKAFLWPAARERSNLHIAIHAHVTKVIIENKKAVGVEVIKDGLLHRIKARKEVILSAGTIGSPQILMLSGVGPKKHLQDLKIPVVADLPVGENLQDHLMVMQRIFIDQPLSVTFEKVTSKQAQEEYETSRTGYKTTPGGLEGVGFVRMDPTLEYGNPDIQYHLVVGNSDKMGYQSLTNIDPKINDHLKWDSLDFFFFTPTLLRPKSVGTIRLRSANPFEYPILQPNYLSAKEDMMLLFKSIRWTQKMLKTKAFKEIGAKLDQSHVQSCIQHKYDSDEYWQCFARSMTNTLFHIIGTCKMGPINDSTTVVDSQLRVKGISGLRVADASIMPYIVSGNTNAPCVMIGEKAADLIKGKTSYK